MRKVNKKLLFVTCLVTLLPILAGLVLWKQLPDQMPIHFDLHNEADRYAGKAFAVFFLPLFLTAMQFIVVLATSLDPKNREQSGKVFILVYWLTPMISVGLAFFLYAIALGKDLNIGLFMPLVLGILFLLLGNYMPKCRPNSTIGIRIPWTLRSEENWDRTHRFAGPVIMTCGAAMLLLGFLGAAAYATLTLAIVAVLIPVIYSYWLHAAKGL